MGKREALGVERGPTPTRECVRALILSPAEEVLLIHLILPDRDLWIAPGGGGAPDESHEQALHRELLEEVGRGDLPIGPQIWVRDGTWEWLGETITQREYFYLVHAERFVADSSGNPVPGEREIMAELRWWRAADLPLHSSDFAPALLGSLIRDLLEKGAPALP